MNIRRLVRIAMLACVAACAPGMELSDKIDAAQELDIVADIIEAAGISSITATVQDDCLREHPYLGFERFASIGFANERIVSGLSAAAFATRSDGTYAVGAVRKYSFLTELHVLSEDGCLEPSELFFSSNTNPQWVNTSVDTAQVAQRFEARIFHAAANASLGLRQLSPIREGAPPYFPQPVRDALQAEVQSGAQASRLRAFGAAALAQLFIGRTYTEMSEHPNWFNHTLYAYDAAAPNLVCENVAGIGSEICSAIPTHEHDRRRSCDALAQRLISDYCHTAHVLALETTLASIAEQPPVGASAEFVELMRVLGSLENRKQIRKELVQRRTRRRDPTVLGNGTFGWVFNVGNGSVLKLALESPHDEIRGVTSLKKQIAGLRVLRNAGFQTASNISEIFSIRTLQNELIAAAYFQYVEGETADALITRLTTETDLTPGMLRGAFKPVYEWPSIETLEFNGMTPDVHPKNFMYTGRIEVLERLIRDNQSRVTRWELPALHTRYVTRRGVNDIPLVTLSARHWNGKTDQETLAAIRFDLGSAFDGSDTHLVQVLQRMTTHADRIADERAQELESHLLRHLVHVDPAQ